MSKQLVIDPEVNAAWQRLTADSSSISWVSFGYPADNSSSLLFKGEGEGGMPELISKFADEAIWAAFKVVGVDDRGNTISRRPKYIFVKFVPESLPTMKKATVGRHKGDIKKIISAHIDIEIENAADLNEEAIIAKLRAAGGAHQPTSYEFSNYSS